MSINPQLLVADTANNDASEEGDGADDQALGEREFFVDRLMDVAVQDLEELGTPLDEYGPEGDRFEVRYLVRWFGFDDPNEDTWEPKRNLAGWQPSYDEDLAKVAANKPPGFNLATLHEEAKRLNEQWRRAQKKSAAAAAKKSTKQAGASTSTKASGKDEKGKKGKGEKKEKKKKSRTSKDGAKPDSSTKSRSGRGSTANASPAPSSSSRVARSLRRYALGESLDQAALNEFIETNAPSSVRSLRFSPPPKHDAHGNLVTPSSDTDDSPTPEPTQQAGREEGATAKEMGYGFAGEDDLEEDGPASAAHSEDVKPSIPSAPISGSGDTYGFAAGDEDEDEDEDELEQDRPAAAVPAPTGETAHGFAGSSDDDDDAEAMQRLEPEPLPAGSATNAEPPIVPMAETASTASTSFGFATADDDDYTDDDHGAMQSLPAGSSANAESPNLPSVPMAETASTSFGFAGDDDDDDMYFPDLTPFEQARAAAVAQPAGQEMLERVKMEDTPQGFAGDSDDEADDLRAPAVDNAAADNAAATASREDADMAEGTAQVELSTNNQRVSEARAQEDHRQSPEVTPNAETARVELIQDLSTGETTQVGGRTRDVGDEQQKLAESPAADAATNEPSLANRHEADCSTSAAVAQSARAAPAGEASAPSTAMSPPPATGGKTAPTRPAPEKALPAAKPTTAANGEHDAAAAESAAQPRVSSSPVASRKSALPHPGREASRDQKDDADATAERARLPTKRKRTADTAGDAAEAGGEATGNALARVKIRRKGEPRAGEVSPVETRPSPGPSGGSDSRGSGSAIKAADPFNHGRIRSNVSNGYIRWNAAALRSRNFPQLLTANEKIVYPDNGPYSVFDGSGDVESEKIKFLWSMGRYGDPINGTDTIDELFKPPLDKTIDVWIAPPPDDNKAGLSKTARAHLHEYQALQLVLSSYEGLRQADSPRNSVKIVFVHVSKLGELGSTSGAFAQLEHLRCRPGTHFFVYGRGENSKRAVFQFWRSAVAITFSPAAVLRQARRLEELLPGLAAYVDESTHTHNVFPWIPLQYLLPGGPLGRPALDDGTSPTPPTERDDANRAAMFEILPLLAHKRLILADLAPPKEQGPLLRSVFPAEVDRVPYAGPQRAFFEILSELGPKMDLPRLQSLICAWRSRYPLIRNWQIICTQQEVAAASKSVLPEIELCSIIEVEKRFLPR